MTQEQLIIEWSDKILNYLLKLKNDPELTFWLRKKTANVSERDTGFRGALIYL